MRRLLFCCLIALLAFSVKTYANNLSSSNFQHHSNLYLRLKKIKKQVKALLKLYLSLSVEEKYLPNLSYEKRKKVVLLKNLLLNSAILAQKKEKKLYAQIKKEEKRSKLLEVKKEIQKEYERLIKLKRLLINPLTKKPMLPSNLEVVVKKSSKVFAPFSGKITSFGLKGKELFVKISGKTCNATLTGIDDLKVGIGTEFKKGELLGEISNTPKKFKMRVWCLNSTGF